MGQPEADQIHSHSLNFCHTEKRLAAAGDGIPPMFYTPYEDDDVAVELTNEMTFFNHQVAGHSNDGKHFGIVKYKEALLKPITKPVCFEREAQFYERVQGATHCACALIQKLVPKFYGRNTVQIGGRQVPALVLEDLTRGMREPCIMDIKIGKRTWDPDATLVKIQHEDGKYQETKREYGFCIPGFQVYDVKTGAFRKFDKAYGKQLNKTTAIDALRIFLNGCERDKPLSRVLLVQLLVNLWRIQHWARKQTTHRLFSSSILLIYDARRLRHMLNINPPKQPVGGGLKRNNSLYRPLSLAVLDACATPGFSGQLAQDGPIFACRALPVPALDCRKQELASRTAPNLKRMHSFHNNYDEELRSIRTDYASILEDLSDLTADRSALWATARMIDFAHAFPSEHAQVDGNYLHGVENLVQILERFLMELS